MKKIVLLLLAAWTTPNIYAQKLNPDVDLISEIISEKQEELKQRVLRNIVVKNIRTTNYTTYNTIYNLVEILTTEKNKTVMTQNLVKEITDYSITYTLADYFVKNKFNLTGLEHKSYNDNVGVYDLMKVNMELSQKESYTSQRALKQPNDSLPEDILVNYVIDTLNAMLGESAFLQSRGLFAKKAWTKRFKSGLDLDYSPIKASGKEALIVSQLNEFVEAINGVLASAEEVFLFINNNEKKFNDLKTLNKGDIGFILKLFEFSLEQFRNEIGKNSFIAKIGDIIATYVIFDMVKDDPEKVYDFKIDVEAIILALEDEFYKSKLTGLKKHKVGVEPFFTIGINYGVLTHSNNDIPTADATGSIYQLAYVAERFGVKFKLADYEYTHSHKPMEWYQYRGSYRRWTEPAKDPLVNDVYGMLFASGLLYNVVDLKSEDNYNFVMVGVGFGLAFFNDLELSLSYAVPVMKDEDPFRNGMISLGFDIPIFEYIRAARNKNQ